MPVNHAFPGKFVIFLFLLTLIVIFLTNTQYSAPFYTHIARYLPEPINVVYSVAPNGPAVHDNMECLNTFLEKTKQKNLQVGR